MRSYKKVMFRLGNLKLRTQLLLSFLLLCAVILVASSFFLYFSIMEILQKNSQESTVASFRQVEKNIIEVRANADSISKAYMMDPYFDNIILNDKQTPFQQIQLITYIEGRLSEQVKLSLFYTNLS